MGRLEKATERLASSMRPLPTSSFGYPVREPVPSEQAFFALNPNVGGYAAEDGAIVLNEGARSGDRYLSNRELGGVARNEAARLYMRDRGIVPDFKLTKDQELRFQGSAYGSNPEALKQSIASRIITGDQSAGETTPEQESFSQSLLKQMRANDRPASTNPEPKQGIMARVANKLEQVLGIPRPWELGLVTSMGYQVATGEGSLGERARRGGAQFLGRYATNMANPALAFQFPKLGEDYQVSDILQDSASWMRPEYYADERTIPIDSMVRGNEVLSRDLFDLPSRIPVEETDLVKTGPKQYTIKEDSPLKPEANEKGLYYNYLLGKYNVTQNPETKALEYNDIWDLSSPLGPAKVKSARGDEDYAPDYAQEDSMVSYMARKIVNPYLKPATVRGRAKSTATNPEPKFKGFPSSHPFVSNKDGSKSNVKLATVGLGDKTFVIPTMVGGKDLPIQQAIKTAKDYGLSNYPSFTNPQDAENWSKKYHGSIDEKGKLKSK